jgi:ribosomal protein L7Ae-like RNA K-turn-binding protein
MAIRRKKRFRFDQKTQKLSAEKLYCFVMAPKSGCGSLFASTYPVLPDNLCDELFALVERIAAAAAAAAAAQQSAGSGSVECNSSTSGNEDAKMDKPPRRGRRRRRRAGTTEVLSSIVRIGINAVSRALEKGELDALIVSCDVRPLRLVQHVLVLAMTKGIPFCVVPMASAKFGAYFGVGTVAAFGTRVRREEEHGVGASTINHDSHVLELIEQLRQFVIVSPREQTVQQPEVSATSATSATSAAPKKKKQTLST